MGPKFTLTAEQVAHACKLREEGERPKTIAKLLNVSKRTLYRAFSHAQHGVNTYGQVNNTTL